GEEFLFGPGIKQRSLKSVFESLRYYNKYNFYNIAIEDVNATTDRKRFVKFCEMLAEFKPNVRLTISTRVDSFNQEIATALSLLNEAIVWFGFESMSSRLMKFLNKGVNIKKNYAAAEICHRHGIDIGANVLVGIPTETTGDIKKTYDFIKDISPSQLYYNVLSPFPGTKIAEYCKSKGVLADIESYERYDVGQVIQKGIIKSVDYDVVRAWMPKFYECVKGHSRALPLERGLVFERGCDFDKAFIEYGKALKSNEDPVRTLYHLGSLLKRTGKSDAALETFNKMNRFDGSANSQNLFYLAQRHFHRGELFYEKKEREMAKKDFQECLTLMPEHKKAREKLNALERK
ncbi:MAG: radical SAM protein, partial [Nitrospinota bacterium]